MKLRPRRESPILAKLTVVAALFGSACAHAADSKPPLPFDQVKTVRVVDGAGQPIAGASVEPWAIRTERGHGTWSVQGYGQSEPPKVTTDDDGRAAIPFPSFTDREGRVPPIALTCRVDHPAYVQSVYNDVPVTAEAVDDVATITLKPGARLEVWGTVDGEPLPIDDLFPQWASDGHEGMHDSTVTPDGTRILPRLPAGREMLRLAYLPDDGAAMFSAIEILDLDDGMVEQVRLRMLPAATVEGRLDAGVPRPVTGGIVVAEVINRHPDGDSGNSLQWRAWTRISEDGTFTLAPLPPGELQVIALCDGFIAASGLPPASEGPNAQVSPSFHCPQVFTAAEGANAIELVMAPTADCEFRVVDPDGNPITDARVSFWPNTAWWGGGSQVYGWPLKGTIEWMTEPDGDEPLDWTDHPFTSVTDAEGMALIRNLPARRQSYMISHDDWQLFNDETRRASGEADLKPGERITIEATMQAKDQPPAP
jgi:hypothetical protein